MQKWQVINALQRSTKSKSTTTINDMAPPTTTELYRKVREAATKRLAAAKAQEASARSMLDTAKRAMGAAQSELEAAKEFLNDANELCPVITIDGESQDQENESQSVVVDVGEEKDLDDGSEEDDGEQGVRSKAEEKECARESEEEDSGSGVESAQNKRRKIQKKNTAVDKIVVKGCGTSGANGTYKREGKSFDVPEYVKKEAGFRYDIFFCHDDKTWNICNRDAGWILYQVNTIGNEFSDEPPKNGWRLCRGGEGPVPHLEWLRG
mmetsp:Transcript_3691/g.9372  ORF Transcript_3691/g.9372 Transcript_3691/m.9372 type:complete len:266 (-) Transcript_3691:100-897(-)